jgi:hypothetical protein
MTLPDRRDRIRPVILRAGLLCAALAIGQISWLGAAYAADKRQGKASDGARPPSPQTPSGGGDRGIGGTGFLGTITKFGSVFVNGAEIFYDADAHVTIDGRRQPSSALKIGQVARVVAVESKSGFRARRITSDHEVVGPITAIDATRSTANVLGQIVEIGTIVGTEQLRPGDWVAVSGIRRPQGTIVASLLETIPRGAAQVIGTVEPAPHGRLQIGALPLLGSLPISLIGKRAIVQGVPSGQALKVGRSHLANFAGAPGSIRRISIEGFFRIAERQIDLAADPNVRLVGRPLNRAAALPDNEPSIIDGLVAPNGIIHVTQIRAADSKFGERHGEVTMPSTIPAAGPAAVVQGSTNGSSTSRGNSNESHDAGDGHTGQSAESDQARSTSHENGAAGSGSASGAGTNGGTASGNAGSDDRGESAAQGSSSRGTSGGKSGDN